MKLWQVIIISGDDHFSMFIAATNRVEVTKIASVKLKAAESIHLIREVNKAVGTDRDYRIILK